MNDVTISPAAEADLQSITDHYLREGEVTLALKFLAAWDTWMRHIEAFPESGSPRLARDLMAPGIRVWPVSGFPQLGFYQVQDRRVTVVRVFHGARDIPAIFRE
jgi:toxin ParE1/3/4